MHHIETEFIAVGSKRVIRFVFLLVVFWGVALGCSVSSADDYLEKVQPLLQQYCYDCHGYGGDEGGLALDEHEETSDVILQRDQWLAVWKNLRAQTMPPSTEEHPTDEERQVITGWIEQSVFRLDANNPDPGRVTVRRLNQREYQNTIKDIFDVDFDATAAFPTDDTGYGFDTIGDTLTVSPFLLEEYLKAAKAIVGKVVVSPNPQIPTKKIEAWQFKGGNLDPYQLKFAKPAKIAFSDSVGHSGEYELTVSLWVRGSAEATNNTAELVLYVNGKEQGRKPIGWDQSLIEMPVKVPLESGDIKYELELVPGEPPGDGEAPLFASISALKVHGPLDGSHNEVQKEYYKVFFDGLPDQSPEKRTRYAKKILRHFAKLAFRRPVTTGYINRLVRLADVNNSKSGSFEDGIARALTVILASPRFIYRSELQPKPNDPGHVVELKEHELASRLSYFLWSSVPDDGLYELASKKRLRKSLRKEVDRMLDDWRSRRLFDDFVGQWLQTDDVYDMDVSVRRIKRADGIPRSEANFGGDIRYAMIEETRHFVEHVFRKDRPLTELVDADYTFLNRNLAEYYGVESESENDSDFAKTTVPAESNRGGLLGQGSILLVTSNPTRTSPVKRGLFILENLLGTPAPPAPPDVPELEEERRGEHKLTMREQMEKHREDPLCASCHARMDPIGLALENFNAIGYWRDEQGDKPIDTAGTLMTGESFESVAELKKVLANDRKRDIIRCVAEKMMTYALGRGLEYYDVPTIDRITDELLKSKNGGTGRELIYAIVESVAFQQRRGDGHPLNQAKQK